MDNAEYLGIYVAGRDVSGTAFPVQNESGLWRTWHEGGGRYLIQALDAGKTPWGEVYAVDAAIFQNILTRLPSEEDILAASGPLLRADAPDLLETWYERIVSSSSQAGNSDRPAASAADARIPRQPGQSSFVPPAALQGRAFSPDGLSEERVQAGAFGEDGGEQPSPAQNEHLLESWSNSAAFRAINTYAAASSAAEEFLETFAPDDSPAPASPPAAAAAFGVPGAAGTAAPPVFSVIPPPAAAPKAAPPQPSRPSSAVGLPVGAGFILEMVEEGDQADAPPHTLPPHAAPAAGQESARPTADEIRDDERALQVENAMRAEFAEYEAHLDDVFQPALEADIEHLLKRGAGFTWKQKYMFSEFGMALRRKRKPKLALKSHLRARTLAPDDASILFNLARTEYELGNPGRARAYLKEALIFVPDFDAALKFLDFLEIHGSEGLAK